MNLLTFVQNNPDLVTLVVGAVGGLIWKRGKDTKASDLWDTLMKLAYQSFPRLYNDKRLYDDVYVREQITKTIWSGLTRLGIPKNAAVSALVDEVVEHAHGELAEKVFAFHVGNLKAPLEGTAETLKTLPQEVPVVAGEVTAT